MPGRQELEEYLKFTEEVVKSAGGLLMKSFFSQDNVRQKGITEYDIKVENDEIIENYITSKITDKYKGHGFVGEESQAKGSQEDFVWYIDPIDGTNNFAIGIPYFGISVVLTYKGTPTISVIYNPVIDEMLSASHGLGAFKNGVKFSYTPIKRPIRESVISFVRGHKTFQSDDLREEGDKLHRKLIDLNPKRMIAFWAPVIDYTLLAQGKIDLLVSFEDELQESLAGYLLCIEAKVPAINFRGKKASYTDTRYIYGAKELIENIVEKI